MVYFNVRRFDGIYWWIRAWHIAWLWGLDACALCLLPTVEVPIRSIQSNPIDAKVNLMQNKWKKKNPKLCTHVHTYYKSTSGQWTLVFSSGRRLSLSRYAKDQSLTSIYFRLWIAADDSICTFHKMVFSPVIRVPLFSSTNLCLLNRLICHRLTLTHSLALYSSYWPIACYLQPSKFGFRSLNHLLQNCHQNELDQ